MRILLWHVHGSWTTSLVQGPHDYIVPVLPGRGPDGLGRARTWQWPASVVEMSPDELASTPVDVILLQRPHELDLAERWLAGRRPGRDIPAIYVEHNSPQGRINHMRHPVSNRSDIWVAHVTHFNRLFWDTGRAPAAVIEHGVVDPGLRYTGELESAAVVVNEPVRRARVTGTDLLETFRRWVPVDLFGMGTAEVGGVENLAQEELHSHMARRRVYLHPVRWTSLGLSLIEAMHLGMPVVALATTEVSEAVPPQAGIVSNRFDVLKQGLELLLNDREQAAVMGKAGREHALRRYGLAGFLQRWDRLLNEVTT